ncbi:MAG: tRNA 2-thiouridine(34) synthase MnmA [Burkholderiales bacterium]|nr:tRNA 2-thiouridine(34) synthase MnmA [Burkholderiales bacterium]
MTGSQGKAPVSNRETSGGKETSGEKIVVGMSGGVDSAVAALLLKRAGHEVVGLFMKNWEDDDDDAYCSTRQDLIDCAAVADVIGIELEAVNFAAEYKERVFSAFLAEYQSGRTPNPDVLCNAEIKFKAFLDHAIALGAGRIATGHYAGVRYVDASVGDSGAGVRYVDASVGNSGAGVREVREDGGVGRFELRKAADRSKDQSYFLHRLSQAQLARAVFPLAQLKKTEVRKIAKEAGLPVHAKKDSTGICFIGERPFREFLNRYLPRTPGAIRTPEGRVIGEHVGLAFYTIGQRKGIGIGGVKGGGSEGEAWYVAAKDMEKNELVVVSGHDHGLLLKNSLCARDLSWVSGSAPDAALACAAKTRYRQADAPCRIARVEEDLLEIGFEQPQWAVTPGQSAVLYQGEVCLGGGVIQ